MKIVTLLLTLFVSCHSLALNYNEVQQKSSHNSYGRDEGILDQLIYHRVRSIEFDLYRSKIGRPSLQDNWYVYHTPVFDTKTNCDTFKSCLKELQTFDRLHPQHEVVTVWFDIKDGFSGAKSPEALDRLITQYIDREDILKPQDLYRACPGASNLKRSVSQGCSWPNLNQLKGKWILVFTDTSYASNRPYRLGFSSAAVDRKSQVDSSSKIFFNTGSSDTSLFKYVQQKGFVVRRYVVDGDNGFNNSLLAGAHHIATNKINYHKDSWSRTHNGKGWPFECFSKSCTNQQEDANILRVSVNSEDIWGSRDNFSFFYLNRASSNSRWISGIHTASSHVDKFAKGCVMARSELSNNSPYFAVCRPADDNPLRVQWRDSYAGGTQSRSVTISGASGISQKDLSFVKLDIYDEGRCAVAFGSRDGREWTKIMSRCFSNRLSYQGLAASSHGNNNINMLFSDLKLWGSSVNSSQLKKANIGTVRSASISNHP
ncbi:Ca2+-dependent phosphoinositide-specific phospholipase C [Agaribacterium haliotis]|uniref:Ca2+-dependent phosphoinositide-specific phospholipase C n=1 Tax=Agaribacterium haliotis TaxID=2013869 RepID=UPI000BB55F28|nr:Ca2+-dependent phosphoinositide-specific phospholipase C [Agaribacterium haliotis]